MFPFRKKETYSPRIEDPKERKKYVKSLLQEDEKIREIKEKNKRRSKKRKAKRFSPLEIELLTIFTKEGYNPITNREGRWGYSQGLTTPILIGRLDNKGIFDGSQTEDDKKDTISQKISKLKIGQQIPFVYRNKPDGKGNKLGRRRYLCPNFEKGFFKRQYDRKISTYRYIQKILDEKSQITEGDLEKEEVIKNQVDYYMKKEEEKI